MFSGSDEKQVAFTKNIIQVIKDKKVIDWTEREDIQKEMRKEIKRLLRSKQCPGDQIEPLAREMISLARIQFKDV